MTSRLAGLDVAPESISLILLTHEHWDHTRGVERFSCMNRIPVGCTRKTLEAMNLSPMHLLGGFRQLATGDVDEFESIRIDPFPIPHDAVDPVGFVLEHEGVRVGIATDLGHVTKLVAERLRGCHVLQVESNHDEAMLRDGPYPWHLKQRVGGRMGHLSNRETAQLLQRVADDNCRAVILTHLSAQNNTAALARDTASRVLASTGSGKIELRITPQKVPAPPVIL
jgi:phosphoribosyl 1,2-cyclic phosphodiesterase